MATKLELDTTVRDLRAQLQALDPKGVAERERALNARIAQLESELDLARDANGRLDAALRKAEDALEPVAAEGDALKAAMGELRDGLDRETRRRAELEGLWHEERERAAGLQSRVDSLAASGARSDDHAVLDGRAFAVVMRRTAKWIHLEYQRRNVQEDATVVVLDRTGE